MSVCPSASHRPKPERCRFLCLLAANCWVQPVLLGSSPCFIISCICSVLDNNKPTGTSRPALVRLYTGDLFTFSLMATKRRRRRRRRKRCSLKGNASSMILKGGEKKWCWLVHYFVQTSTFSRKKKKFSFSHLQITKSFWNLDTYLYFNIKLFFFHLWLKKSMLPATWFISLTLRRWGALQLFQQQLKG